MNTSQTKRLEEDYSKILVAIFEIMLKGGIRTKDLLPICVRSLECAEQKLRSTHSSESGGLVTAALVLDAWHRNGRYVGREGAPRAVPLLGAGPSVEALVRLQGIRKRAAAVAHRLKNLHLLVPCGNNLYRPASDVAVISASDPVVLQHAARVLLTLLETVGRNVSNARNPAPLIERFAEVPDLPRKYVNAFRTFTQSQGRTFLRTVNDWLESRRAPRSSQRERIPTVRAGIHAYAYIAQRRRTKRG
jgi:hypothetical protein